MGRPLKIKKYSPGSGVGTYQQGVGVDVDIGFNMWSQLTNPEYPTTMTSSNFLGVVGGANAIGGTTIASSSYPVVKCVAYVPGDSQYRNAFIITQKGTIKYQVAAINDIAVTALVPGQAYIIKTVGNTNWKAVGGPSNAQAYDVFTATVAGTGTGVAYLVGTCALVNDTTPASGQMSITMNVNGDSTEIGISKLTNKFALDYSTPPVRYAVNFFTDEGTERKSGTQNIANSATQQNILDLGQIDNYTS